jgi:hypothetical protein
VADRIGLEDEREQTTGAGVRDRRSVNLSLELEPGSDPIAGRVAGPDGTFAEFTGWLELTQALEAARQVSPRPDTPERG